MTNEATSVMTDEITQLSAVAQAEQVDGWMTAAELNWLYEHAYGASIEIGSHKGRSATVLALKLKQSGGQLSCVDCWWEEEIYQEFLSNIAKVDFPVSALRMSSVQAVEQFPDQSLDFVFIDSSHEYDDTVAEILAWLPKLRPEGLLCGHDYTHPAFPGLDRAVQELCYGFEHPVDSIWAIRVSQFNPSHRRMFELLRQAIIDLAQTQAQLQQTQAEYQFTQAQPQQTQAQLQQIQTQHHVIEEQLQQTQQQSTETLQATSVELSQTQAELQQAQQQLGKVQNRVQKLKAKAEHLQSQLESSLNEIEAMKSSKFWKLRTKWVGLKRKVGFSSEK
ncbi:MAG TPA: class I SAM-dependent methyltransferase [Trichocoleus sp.]